MTYVVGVHIIRFCGKFAVYGESLKQRLQTIVFSRQVAFSVVRRTR